METSKKRRGKSWGNGERGEEGMGGRSKIVEWARQPRDGEEKEERRENVAPSSNVLIAAFSPITVIPWRCTRCGDSSCYFHAAVVFFRPVSIVQSEVNIDR